MYRNTFYLVNGDEIVTYSNSRELESYKYEDVAVFVSEKDKMRYTIPVISILYIETEEVDNRCLKE